MLAALLSLSCSLQSCAAAAAAAVDLKAANVLLKMELAAAAAAAAAAAGSSNAASSQSGGCNKQQQQQQPTTVAKVADFGLATRLDEQETHVSGVHRVRRVDIHRCQLAGPADLLLVGSCWW
jgi:hypothetical protein